MKKIFTLAAGIFMLGLGQAGANSAVSSLPGLKSSPSLSFSNVGKAQVPADWSRASALIKRLSSATPSGSANVGRIGEAADYADSLSKELVAIAKRNSRDERLFSYIVREFADISMSVHNEYYQYCIFRNLAAIVSCSDRETTRLTVISMFVNLIGDDAYSREYVDLVCGLAKGSTLTVRQEAAKLLLSAMRPQYNKGLVRFIGERANSLR